MNFGVLPRLNLHDKLSQVRRINYGNWQARVGATEVVPASIRASGKRIRSLRV